MNSPTKVTGKSDGLILRSRRVQKPQAIQTTNRNSWVHL